MFKEIAIDLLPIETKLQITLLEHPQIRSMLCLVIDNIQRQ